MSAFTDAIDHYLDGLSFAGTGAAASCPECLIRHGHDPDDVQTREEIERVQAEELDHVEGGFSWTQCDSCGTTLGGHRETAHAFDADGHLYCLSVCADCTIYHANGDEPEEGTWK